jgi:hypothetical protein
VPYLRPAGTTAGRSGLNEAFEILRPLSQADDRPWEVRFAAACMLAEAWDIRAALFGDGGGYESAVATVELLAAQAPSPREAGARAVVSSVVAAFCVWRAAKLHEEVILGASGVQSEALAQRLDEVLDRGLAQVEYGMTSGSGSVEQYADLLGKWGLLEALRDPASAASRMRQAISAMPSEPRSARVWPMLALADSLVTGVERGATETADKDLDEATQVLQQVPRLEPLFEAVARRMLVRVERLRWPPVQGG